MVKRLMNKEADYTIIGCKDEVEFIKLLGNPYVYEDIINSSIYNLDPDNFLNIEEYYSRMADFQCLKLRYKNEFIQKNSGSLYKWTFSSCFIKPNMWNRVFFKIDTSFDE